MLQAMQETTTSWLFRRPAPAADLQRSEDDRWLNRVLLIAVVLAVAWTAWLVATAAAANGDTGPATYGCVEQTLAEARDFTAVLGDHRPVDRAFAEQWCSTRPFRP